MPGPQSFHPKSGSSRRAGFYHRTMAATLNGRLRRSYSCDEESPKSSPCAFPSKTGRSTAWVPPLTAACFSTMLDLAMSMAVYCFSRQSIPPTISMTVNYLRSRPHGGQTGVLIRSPFDLSGPPQRHRLL